MSDNYLNQSAVESVSGMNGDIVRQFEAFYQQGVGLPAEFETNVRKLAIDGSHMARNMLHLSGIKMVYDGQPFEYQPAKLIELAGTNRTTPIYDQWRDQNES